MPEKRVTVWVQRFKDRPHLMLQWTDPDTGRRKSKSAETALERRSRWVPSSVFKLTNATEGVTT
jgi:hypothetical protein